MSQVVSSEQQPNGRIQTALLDSLSRAIEPGNKVIIVTDAGFQNAGFRLIKSPGWDVTGRV